MGLNATPNSTYAAVEGAIRYGSNSTQNASIVYSSQVGNHEFVQTGSTSSNNQPLGHISLPGSTESALSYVLNAPIAPYGHRLSVLSVKSTSSAHQLVWASTDNSVTWDGTNQVIRFSSNSAYGHNFFTAVAISSQRYHLTAGTTMLTLSTGSTA